MIGAYYCSWSSPWVSDSGKMDLALLKDVYPGLEVVYISFAQPDMNYTSGSFNGTGIQFSQDFAVVRGAISILKSRGVIVMLSVGGGAYWSVTKNFNVKDIGSLVRDLGVDGVDLDWEVGVSDSMSLTSAIKAFRGLMSGWKLSIAGFSTGAYGPKGNDTYMGMNIDALVNAGGLIDWVNIMTYDAGPTFDPLGSLDCYRIYYKGPLNIGYEVGVQSWGGYLLTNDDVLKMANYSKNNNSENGVFIWCIGKAGNPSVADIINTCVGVFGNNTLPVPAPVVPTPVAIPVVVTTQAVGSLICGVCKTVYLKQ